MNILIIGNGFDLTHGLPTKYGDFLDFCERARRIYTYREDASLNVYKCDNLDNWEMNDDIKNKQAKQFINRWMDTTRSTLLFSKGNILVEGLAEALLIPKLAEIYLSGLKLDNAPKSLEEEGH